MELPFHGHASENMIIPFALDFAAVSVSISTLGINLLNGLYMFYYVKVFLLIYKIDDDWFKSTQTTLIIVHLINEPIIGYVQDYACMWMRNRRKTILVSGPILALVYLIPWFNWYNPDDAPAWMPGLHFVLALTTWSIAYPFVNTALRGLFFDISVDERHRVKIVRYAEIANVVATTALLPMDKISYSLNNYENFQYGCLVVAAISCACFILTGLSKWENGNGVTSEKQPLVENEKKEGEQQSSKTSKTNDKENIEELFTESEHLQFSSLKTAWIVSKEILSSKNFWFMAGTYFTFWFRTQTIGSFFAIFTEILVSPDILPTGSYSLAIYYTMSLMLPRIVLVICTPIAHRIGTKRLIMFTLVFTWINSGVGLLAGLTVSSNVAIVYLLIESILLRFQSMFAVIACDFIEEDTIVHNRKLPASTLIFTLDSSVVKSTISLAPLITAAFLASAGYTEYHDDLRDTPQKFKNLVSLIACGIPAVCALIGFLLFNFYVSYKDRPEICGARTLRKFSSYERIP